MRLEDGQLRVVRQRLERLDLLVRLAAPDVELAGAVGQQPVAVLRLVVTRMELEADVEVRRHVRPGRVQVRRREDDVRPGAQEQTGLRIEVVGVAPHLVHRPEALLVGGRAHDLGVLVRVGPPELRELLDRVLLGMDDVPHQVVDAPPRTDGIASARRLDVVDLLHLDGRHVAVLGQTLDGHLPDRPPPVGVGGADLDRRRRDDQVGLADRPDGRVGELEQRRRVGRVAARRPVVDPRRDGLDLRVAQGGVALVVLDADVLLDVPGRHRVLRVPQAGALPDAPRPGPRVLVGDQRHRGSAVRAVALLAAPLQNRRDVLRPGDLGLLRRRGSRESGAEQRRRRAYRPPPSRPRRHV